MITKRELANGRFFVGHGGAQLHCIDPKGNVQWTVGYLPGIHFADTLSPYMREGEELQADGPIELLKTTSRVTVTPYGEGANETGANPDFRPTSATEAELRMRKMLRDANKAEKRLEKRMKTFQQMQAKSAAPEVIENETAETPKTAPQGGETATPEGEAPQGEKAAE